MIQIKIEVLALSGMNDKEQIIKTLHKATRAMRISF